MNTVYKLVLMLAVLAASAPAFAAETTVPASTEQPSPPISAQNPSSDAVAAQLDPFLQRMQANPDDLDAFYAYAEIAAKHGYLRQAANAYNHMLEKKPELHRIKLSLALVYIRMGMLLESKVLLEEVNATNPPEQVAKNIKTTLATIESYLKDKSKYPAIGTEPSPIAETQDQDQAHAELQKEAATPPQPPKPPSKKEMKARLKELEGIMEKNPDNLDAKFEYAQISGQLNKIEEAIAIYEEMLAAHPDLPRIKLDLGMMYARATMYEKALDMFNKVLASDPPPPEPVQKNIEAVLESLKTAMKQDKISGSVSLAYNNDTNATSAASSNQTTYANLSIPLAGSSTAQPDQQVVAMASLTHTHIFRTNSPKWGLNLATTGLFYRSDQATEHNLDINLISLKTGPTLSLPGLRSQFGLGATTSLTRLDSHAYTKTQSGDISWKFMPFSKLLLDASGSMEYRSFMNSPTSSTNTDRSGPANQQSIGATFLLTPKDIFNVTNTWRNEDAQLDKYGLDQISLTGTYMRSLPWDMAFTAAFGFKKSHYNDLDTTVSTTTLRNDRERSMTYSLSKKMFKNITISASYQYKNVTSNIQNYDYVNHRTGMTVSWGF